MAFRRVREAILAGKSAAQPQISPPKLHGRKLKAGWALIHFDNENELEEHLRAHILHCSSSGLRCVVISNRLPPSLLSKPEIIFEFVPTDSVSARDQQADSSLAREYLFSRLLHIISFWDVVGCTWKGDRANEILCTTPQDAVSLLAMSQGSIQETAKVVKFSKSGI